jgi:drug/metabolite transporter (DMT)-like permease
LWAAASATAYSLSSVVGKDLLDSLGPTSLLFWRFTVATSVLWAVLAVWRRRGGPDPMAIPKLTGLGLGVMFGLLVLLGFIALQRLDASVYIVIVYTYPVFVVVGSTFLGVRAGWATWVALAVVMVGVVLTVPQLFDGSGEIDGFGVFLTIAQALVFAAFMIVAGRYMPRSVDGVVVAAWQTLGAAIVMTPLALGKGLVAPRGGHLLLEVALFALIPTVVSSVCFFRALRHIAPGIAAMVLTLEVALAIIWSVLFLGEEVRAIQIMGAAVVVTGVLLAQWVNANAARRSEAATAELLAATPPPV